MAYMSMIIFILISISFQSMILKNKFDVHSKYIFNMFHFFHVNCYLNLIVLCMVKSS
jgi:hypothetical protein